MMLDCMIHFPAAEILSASRGQFLLEDTKRRGEKLTLLLLLVCLSAPAWWPVTFGDYIHIVRTQHAVNMVAVLSALDNKSINCHLFGIIYIRSPKIKYILYTISFQLSTAKVGGLIFEDQIVRLEPNSVRPKRIPFLKKCPVFIYGEPFCDYFNHFLSAW